MKKVRPSEGIRRAYQRLAATFADGKVALTLPQTALLRTLLEQGPLFQRQIKDFCGLDRSTLSDVLKRLATAGMVVAVRRETDQRAVMVSLTPAGRAALLKAETVLADAEAAMMKMVPSADRAAFLRSLRAIAEAS